MVLSCSSRKVVPCPRSLRRRLRHVVVSKLAENHVYCEVNRCRDNIIRFGSKSKNNRTPMNKRSNHSQSCTDREATDSQRISRVRKWGV